MKNYYHYNVDKGRFGFINGGESFTFDWTRHDKIIDFILCIMSDNYFEVTTEDKNNIEKVVNGLNTNGKGFIYFFIKQNNTKCYITRYNEEWYDIQ